MDTFSKRKRSEIMSRIKSRDSKIEIMFRKKLWSRGFRYLKNSGKYFGKPDIVLPKYKTVIFIDSCFWHGCRKHGSMPATNKNFWREKIERNKKRDLKVNREYKKRGWTVLRVWEHHLKMGAEKAVFNIAKIIDENKSTVKQSTKK
jgi:DNA mismatch endonuclease (patch repair protein)